jgi:hypothetical protein
MNGRESLIIYGNCQAEFVCGVLRRDAAVAQRFDAGYLPSFQHRDQREPSPAPGDLERCTVFLEQLDWNPFAQRDRLPPACTTVRFPPLDSLLLWPFNSPNPFNEPDAPHFPWGRFLFGDRVILKEIARNKTADEVLAFYLNGWDDYKVNMKRAAELERHRLAGRDAACDVISSDLVLDSLSTERRFWNVGHPTKALMIDLTERIIAACVRQFPGFPDVDVRRIAREYSDLGGFLQDVSVPIHPEVAAALALTWYNPAEPHQQYGGISYTYEQYFAEMIRYCIDNRAAQHAAKAPDPQPPLSGPVTASGAIGFFPDGFIGERLLFDLTATAPISSIDVRGFCPPQHAHGLHLRCVVGNGSTVTAQVLPETMFSLTCRATVPAGGCVRVELQSSDVMNPRERGIGPDERDLSVIILSIDAR